MATAARGGAPRSAGAWRASSATRAARATTARSSSGPSSRRAPPPTAWRSGGTTRARPPASAPAHSPPATVDAAAKIRASVRAGGDRVKILNINFVARRQLPQRRAFWGSSAAKEDPPATNVAEDAFLRRLRRFGAGRRNATRAILCAAAAARVRRRRGPPQLHAGRRELTDEEVRLVRSFLHDYQGDIGFEEADLRDATFKGAPPRPVRVQARNSTRVKLRPYRPQGAAFEDAVTSASRSYTSLSFRDADLQATFEDTSLSMTYYDTIDFTLGASVEVVGGGAGPAS